jgi:hypothetical protein
LLFWIATLTIRWRSAPREEAILEGAEEGYAAGFTGEERGTWCPDRQRKLFN